MPSRPCIYCGALIALRAQIPNQKYCNSKPCQRERQRLWQSTKRHSDLDYLRNQAEAQRTWVAKNPDYWRSYRDAHPEYTEKNRTAQRKRNRQSREFVIAKSDLSALPAGLPEGLYHLRPLDDLHCDAPGSDGWVVHLKVLAAL